jgi:FtsH-binding integral membrane protein
MAFVGTIIQRDLSTVGRVCFMALWGVLITCLVNLFVRSSALGPILDFAILAIFIGLSAYDAQNVRKLADAETRGDISPAEANRLGLILALELYLDVIILFETILRFVGDRK